MVHAILTSVFVVLALYIGWTLVQGYREAVGTTWERLIAAARYSATILWARFVILVSALSALLVEVADWLNIPGLSDTIRSVMKPEYVAAFTIVVMLVSEFARRRSLPLV